MVRRYFTVVEANALLPTLEGELRRAQGLLARARACQREMQLCKAVGSAPGGGLIMEADYRAAERDLERSVGELEMRVLEIQACGCELKDLERGLIDFPAFLDGDEVLLCWQLGEPEIAYYHDRYSGFRGRRPL